VYQQNYDPFGNVFLSTLVAAVPILALLYFIALHPHRDKQGNRHLGISAPYAALAVDKAPGFKTWTITAMVQEWLASPASNFGLVLNSDATVARDRYRYFASTKHADPTLWPVMEITYSLPGDTTPPVISAVVSSSITRSGATISWSTDEGSDSQIEYGLTTAYGSSTVANAAPVTAHSQLLGGLLEARVYHYRVRSRDEPGAKSGRRRAAVCARSTALARSLASRLAALAACRAARARSAVIGETILRSNAPCTRARAAFQSPCSSLDSSTARQAQGAVRARP